MAMTEQQLQTFRDDILANQDPAVVQALADRVDSEIARLYNLPAVPDFWIWRNAVTLDEIMQNEGFDWVRVDNLSVGKARIWEWMFKNQSQSINPTKPNIRAGIGETWKGTAADTVVRGVIFEHCQKKASQAELLFATGDGTPTTIDGVGPGDASFHGAVTTNDVSNALNV